MIELIRYLKRKKNPWSANVFNNHTLNRVLPFTIKCEWELSIKNTPSRKIDMIQMIHVCTTWHASCGIFCMCRYPKWISSRHLYIIINNKNNRKKMTMMMMMILPPSSIRFSFLYVHIYAFSRRFVSYNFEMLPAAFDEH